MRAELARARERVAELTIASPADGVFVLAGAPRTCRTATEARASWSATWCGPTAATVRVLVSQDDVDLVRARTERVRGEAGRTRRPRRYAAQHPARGAGGERRACRTPRSASPAAASSPLDPRDPQGRTALRALVRVRARAARRERRCALGERVYVRFEHGSEPLAARLYRSVRQLFMTRFMV